MIISVLGGISVILIFIVGIDYYLGKNINTNTNINNNGNDNGEKYKME